MKNKRNGFCAVNAHKWHVKLEMFTHDFIFYLGKAMKRIQWNDISSSVARSRLSSMNLLAFIFGLRFTLCGAHGSAENKIEAISQPQWTAFIWRLNDFVTESVCV